MTIEKTLFAAADKMRGSMDPGEYKHVALGLLFLRYISIAFQRKHDELAAEEGQEVAEDVDEYLADGIFWVPEAARWRHLSANAKDPKIGVMVDDAMRAIEDENEQLKGALPKVFGRDGAGPRRRHRPDRPLLEHRVRRHAEGLRPDRSHLRILHLRVRLERGQARRRLPHAEAGRRADRRDDRAA